MAVQYLNLVLVGRMGCGKSTTGNKLIQASTSSAKVIKRWTSTSLCSTLLQDFSESSTQPKMEFAVGHGEESCTRQCEMLSSGKVRVLDVPGFGGSERPEGTSVKQLNTQYIRWIVRIRDEFKMRIHRVLYFIPQRGVLRKADGVMKEELECLQHFFGNAIFESMIMITTYDPFEEEQQKRGFSQKEFNAMRPVLSSMFSSMPKVKDKAPCVPPVIYLGINDSPEDVYERIMQTPVLHVDGLDPSIVEGTCIKCANKVEYSAIVDEKKPEPIFVRMTDGTCEPYAESKCHPLFIPKHARITKIVGGIAHIMTLGAFYFMMDKSWPGFTNADEKCIACKGPPGSNGCKVIRGKYTCGDGKDEIMVQHSSTIEYISATTIM